MAEEGINGLCEEPDAEFFDTFFDDDVVETIGEVFDGVKPVASSDESSCEPFEHLESIEEEDRSLKHLGPQVDLKEDKGKVIVLKPAHLQDPLKTPSHLSKPLNPICTADDLQGVSRPHQGTLKSRQAQHCSKSKIYNQNGIDTRADVLRLEDSHRNEKTEENQTYPCTDKLLAKVQTVLNKSFLSSIERNKPNEKSSSVVEEEDREDLLVGKYSANALACEGSTNLLASCSSEDIMKENISDHDKRDMSSCSLPENSKILTTSNPKLLSPSVYSINSKSGEEMEVVEILTCSSISSPVPNLSSCEVSAVSSKSDVNCEISRDQTEKEDDISLEESCPKKLNQQSPKCKINLNLKTQLLASTTIVASSSAPGEKQRSLNLHVKSQSDQKPKHSSDQSNGHESRLPLNADDSPLGGDEPEKVKRTENKRRKRDGSNSDSSDHERLRHRSRGKDKRWKRRKERDNSSPSLKSRDKKKWRRTYVRSRSRSPYLLKNHHRKERSPESHMRRKRRKSRSRSPSLPRCYVRRSSRSPVRHRSRSKSQSPAHHPARKSPSRYARRRKRSRSKSPFINEISRLKRQWDKEDEEKRISCRYPVQPSNLLPSHVPSWANAPGNSSTTVVSNMLSVSVESVQLHSATFAFGNNMSTVPPGLQTELFSEPSGTGPPILNNFGVPLSVPGTGPPILNNFGVPLSVPGTGPPILNNFGVPLSVPEYTTSNSGGPFAMPPPLPSGFLPMPVPAPNGFLPMPELAGLNQHYPYPPDGNRVPSTPLSLPPPPMVLTAAETQDGCVFPNCEAQQSLASCSVPLDAPSPLLPSIQTSSESLSMVSSKPQRSILSKQLDILMSTVGSLPEAPGPSNKSKENTTTVLNLENSTSSNLEMNGEINSSSITIKDQALVLGESIPKGINESISLPNNLSLLENESHYVSTTKSPVGCNTEKLISPRSQSVEGMHSTGSNVESCQRNERKFEPEVVQTSPLTNETPTMHTYIEQPDGESQRDAIKSDDESVIVEDFDSDIIMEEPPPKPPVECICLSDDEANTNTLYNLDKELDKICRDSDKLNQSNCMFVEDSGPLEQSKASEDPKKKKKRSSKKERRRSQARKHSSERFSSQDRGIEKREESSKTRSEAETKKHSQERPNDDYNAVLKECHEMIDSLRIGRFVITEKDTELSSAALNEKNSTSILWGSSKVEFSYTQKPMTSKASNTRDRSTNTSVRLLIDVCCGTDNQVCKDLAVQTDFDCTGCIEKEDLIRELNASLLSVMKERDDLQASLLCRSQTIPGLDELSAPKKPSTELIGCHVSKLSSSSIEVGHCGVQMKSNQQVYPSVRATALASQQILARDNCESRVMEESGSVLKQLHFISGEPSFAYDYNHSSPVPPDWSRPFQ